MQLKKIEPEDLMPNIQYWIGEVHLPHPAKL